MEIPFVDLGAQYARLHDEVSAAVDEVITRSAFVGGEFVKAFEEDFARFCGVEHCIGVGNGTDAICLALRALGVGAGHEVLVPANSFIATSEAVTMAGARPAFVDCDPLTYNMDVERLTRAITSRSKAVIPVHLYGRPAQMAEIKQIASDHGLFVVEDAAQAHGAEYHGVRCGALAEVACFSFYPGKNLGAYGDAGAIVTNNGDLARQARMLANHGRMSKYDHEFEGVNSRLDGLQAAVLSVKLRHLEEWTEERRSRAALYRDLLDPARVVCPQEEEGLRHVYHLFAVQVRERDRVREELGRHGIAAGVHYPIALPNLKAYAGYGYSPDDYPVASRFSAELLSLPIYPELSDEAVRYVAETMNSVCALL